MKSKERHQLKQNDFAQTATKVAESLREQSSRAVTAIGAVVAIGVIVGGLLYWRKHTADQAGALLATAITVEQAPIAPPSTLPTSTQSVNTFPTEAARAEAALKAFQAVTTQFPSSDAAVAAKYHSAGALLTLGRTDEARTVFQEVVESSGSSIYQPMARLGIAQVLLQQSKNDDAIKAFTDLAADRDGPLPVDGVLMQLAAADVKAGKNADARAAYKRIVDEFPESGYVADAKTKMAALN
jgi:TolA-binding protein